MSQWRVPSVPVRTCSCSTSRSPPSTLPRRRRIVDALLGIRDRTVGVPLIYVTHLPEEALTVADWAVLIDNGRILAEGPPKQMFESFGPFGSFGSFGSIPSVESPRSMAKRASLVRTSRTSERSERPERPRTNGCYAQSVLREMCCASILILAVLLSGCRQADGAMPEATASVAERARRHQPGPAERGDRNPTGVRRISPRTSATTREGTNGGEAAAQELARRLGQALTGKMFKLAQAMPVAHSAWVTVAARQLSEQQIENLKNEMKSELMSLGANEQQAQSVADQVGVVQQAVTARHRRWYELL